MNWLIMRVLFLVGMMLFAISPQVLGNEPLKGSVEMSEHLSALDPTLSAGCTFDQAAATELLGQKANENQWYKIPSWLAGRWEQHEAVTTYSKDEKTGKEDNRNHPYVSNSHETWGHFPSKDGWWQFADSNYWTTTEHDNIDGHAFIRCLQLVDSTPDSITTKSESTQFSVDHKTNKIVLVTQRETVLVYTRITDNLFRENESHRNYDANGELLYTAKNTSNSKKISDETYTVTPAKLTSLTEYLKNHDMTDEIKNVKEAALAKFKMVPVSSAN